MVTLADIVADRVFYSLDSTTVRTHVSAAGREMGAFGALLPARGAGSSVNFSVWQRPEELRSRFTCPGTKRTVPRLMSR